jgi:hypothetical protein
VDKAPNSNSARPTADLEAASNDGRVSERGAGLHDDDVPATERVFPVVV